MPAWLPRSLLSLLPPPSMAAAGRPPLEQCLALLGMNAIKTIVINESVMVVFNRFYFGSRRRSAFWGHSLPLR